MHSQNLFIYVNKNTKMDVSVLLRLIQNCKLCILIKIQNKLRFFFLVTRNYAEKLKYRKKCKDNELNVKDHYVLITYHELQ